MRDSDCVQFLQWALPRMRMKWSGFRKVRRQVCRRIQRRMLTLGLAGYDAYRDHLEVQPEEWQTLDGLCRITISRFYRDKSVFDLLGSTIFPGLAQRASSRERPLVSVWSAGCGSGEEPYTVALLWEYVLKHDYPECDVEILATDSNKLLLRRATDARYSKNALREIPVEWDGAFECCADEFVLHPRHRERVHFAAHDLRTELPSGPFDMVLCRNLAFTYFDDELQREVVSRIEQVLRPGGYLVIGTHEVLPEGTEGLRSDPRSRCLLNKG